MDTKYASAERASEEQIKLDKEEIETITHIREVLNALPYVAAILNEQRQIIYSNQVLLDSVGDVSIEQILGKRPGEALNCINSNKEPGGCGTSENCRICGAVNAVLESQKTGTKVSKECRITSGINNDLTAFDYLVTSNPFYWNKHKYTILSLSDISHEKRRRALEKIFFHDIINKAGSLSGFLDLLKDLQDAEKIKEYLGIAERIIDELTEEILTQRSLIAAESGELESEPKPSSSLDNLKNIVIQMMLHEVSKNKNIITSNSAVNITFEVDTILLNRVLVNMMKNALEATDEGGKVEVGCDLLDSRIVYWVHNEKVMSEEVKLQVFQRSFSTKDTNRGLGTYSIKLIGEKYLRGKVYFTSEKGSGTRFCIELSLKQ